MVITRETLTSEALTLPLEERMMLVRQLLESVEPEPTAEVEAAWEEEIARRITRFRSGESMPVPLADHLGRLDQLFL